jgi:hypothetical protein
MCFIAEGCNAQSPEEKYEKLKTYLIEIADTLDIEDYDCILYVSENGCPTCSKSFDRIVKEYAFNRKRILIILNAKGHIFDIIPYLDSGANNVVKDFTTAFYRLKIATMSCMITLKDKHIEEIVEVKPEQLGNQLDLLQKTILKTERTVSHEP